MTTLLLCIAAVGAIFVLQMYVVAYVAGALFVVGLALVSLYEVAVEKIRGKPAENDHADR